MSAGNQLGELVVGLRTNHQIHSRRAVHDLLTFGLGDAAGDGDGHTALATCFLFLTHFTQATDFRIDLLGGLFTDMAGIQKNQIGALGLVGDFIAQRTQDIDHALAVIDVHLTAVSLNVELL